MLLTPHIVRAQRDHGGRPAADLHRVAAEPRPRRPAAAHCRRCPSRHAAPATAATPPAAPRAGHARDAAGTGVAARRAAARAVRRRRTGQPVRAAAGADAGPAPLARPPTLRRRRAQRRPPDRRRRRRTAAPPPAPAPPPAAPPAPPTPPTLARASGSAQVIITPPGHARSASARDRTRCRFRSRTCRACRRSR